MKPNTKRLLIFLGALFGGIALLAIGAVALFLYAIGPKSAKEREVAEITCGDVAIRLMDRHVDRGLAYEDRHTVFLRADVGDDEFDLQVDRAFFPWSLPDTEPRRVSGAALVFPHSSRHTLSQHVFLDVQAHPSARRVEECLRQERAAFVDGLRRHREYRAINQERSNARFETIVFWDRRKDQPRFVSGDESLSIGMTTVSLHDGETRRVVGDLTRDAERGPLRFTLDADVRSRVNEFRNSRGQTLSEYVGVSAALRTVDEHSRARGSARRPSEASPRSTEPAAAGDEP